MDHGVWKHTLIANGEWDVAFKEKPDQSMVVYLVHKNCPKVKIPKTSKQGTKLPQDRWISGRLVAMMHGAGEEPICLACNKLIPKKGVAQALLAISFDLERG